MYSVNADIEKSVLTIELSEYVSYSELLKIFGEIIIKRREFSKRHTALIKLSNITADQFYLEEVDQQVLTGKLINMKNAVILIGNDENDTRPIAEELLKTYEKYRIPCVIVTSQDDVDKVIANY